MLANCIEFQYLNYKVEEFEVYCRGNEFVIKSEDFIAKLSEFHFEELRRKLNELHDDMN